MFYTDIFISYHKIYLIEANWSELKPKPTFKAKITVKPGIIVQA